VIGTAKAGLDMLSRSLKRLPPLSRWLADDAGQLALRSRRTGLCSPAALKSAFGKRCPLGATCFAIPIAPSRPTLPHSMNAHASINLRRFSRASVFAGRDDHAEF
jgi:hypothetical protein